MRRPLTSAAFFYWGTKYCEGAMTKHVMLNNITHKNLRVISRHGAEFGDNIGTVMIVPTEFADMQREYPIFFRKRLEDR